MCIIYDGDNVVYLKAKDDIMLGFLKSFFSFFSKKESVEPEKYEFEKNEKCSCNAGWDKVPWDAQYGNDVELLDSYYAKYRHLVKCAKCEKVFIRFVTAFI